jgi:Tol biopolymer transport system component
MSQRQVGPRFSPDGRSVSFLSRVPGNPDSTQIVVADNDGDDRRTVAWGGTHSWSPDSRFIAYDRRDKGGYNLYVVEASGGEPRAVVIDQEFAAAIPSWSRDGRWIYFGRDGPRGWNVWKVPFAERNGLAGNAVQVTRHGGNAPVEGPDGRYVYYFKPPITKGAIWRVPVDGGLEEPVIESINSGTGFWDVAETGIYFAHTGQESGGTNQTTLKLYRFATQEISDVMPLPSKPFPGAPGLDISPDGRSMLYMRVSSSADLKLLEGLGQLR